MVTRVRVVIVTRGRKLTLAFDQLPATVNDQNLILPKGSVEFDAPIREDHALAPAILSATEWEKIQSGEHLIIVYGTRLM